MDDLFDPARFIVPPDEAWLERFLPLPGGVNFRDTGGYRTTDGRTVRRGHIYRAGSLAELDEAGLAYLAGLGLSRVYDLRSADEAARHPDRLPPGVVGVHRPVLGQVSRLRGLYTLYRARRQPQVMLEGMYRLFLDQNGPVFADILRASAEPDNTPLLIHCAIGKDRTGLAVALLLLTLGVPEETVVADYTLSNHAADAMARWMWPEMARLNAYGFDQARLRPVLLAEARTMAGSLAYLRRRYGSPEQYWRQSGIDDETLTRLRDNLLV
jgi:protein-tyrosine phosphatase